MNHLKRICPIQSLLLIVVLVTCTNLCADEPQPAPVKTDDKSSATVAGSQFYFDYLTANVLLATNQLGIEVAPAEKALCAQLGIQGGLVITSAPEGSEGAKAGLQAHDLVLNVNNPRSEQVRDVDQLNTILAANAGKSIEIGLLRAGKMQLIALTVPQPQNLTVQFPRRVGIEWLEKHSSADRYRLGISLAEADDTLRAQLQLPAKEGLVVTEVLAGTPAEKAGIKQHDVLVELDGKRLAKVEEVTQQVQEIKSRSVTAKLVRHGKPETVEVAPEKVAFSSSIGSTDAAYYVLDSSSSIPNEWARALYSGNRPQDGLSTALFFTRPFNVTAPTQSVTTATSKEPQAQINAMKQQLEEMQKLLMALETSMAASQKSAAPTSEEKK